MPTVYTSIQQRTATTEAAAAAVTEAVSVLAGAPSEFVSMAEAVRPQSHPIKLLKEAMAAATVATTRVELQHVVHPAKKPLSLVRASLQDLSSIPAVRFESFRKVSCFHCV